MSAPQNSKSNNQSALTLARNLASRSTNLHDAAKELNRSSPPPASTVSPPEAQVPPDQNGGNGGEGGSLADPTTLPRRHSSVQQIVQQFEEKLTLERTSNATPDTMSQASSNLMDYSDDDEDESQSELSFSMDSVNSFNPPGNLARALASNSANPNPNPNTFLPHHLRPPKAPPSPSSSINNHYISSTEVSPVPWEMMNSMQDNPNLSYPASEEEPQYKLNPKFINVPVSSSPPQQGETRKETHLESFSTSTHLTPSLSFLPSSPPPPPTQPPLCPGGLLRSNET